MVRTEWACAHFFVLGPSLGIRTRRRRAGADAWPSAWPRRYGLEIFDVQFRREAPGMVLRVQIDRPGPAGDRRGERQRRGLRAREPRSQRDPRRRGLGADRRTRWRFRRRASIGRCAARTTTGGSPAGGQDRDARAGRRPDVFRGTARAASTDSACSSTARTDGAPGPLGIITRGESGSGILET